MVSFDRLVESTAFGAALMLLGALAMMSAVRVAYRSHLDDEAAKTYRLLPLPASLFGAAGVLGYSAAALLGTQQATTFAAVAAQVPTLRWSIATVFVAAVFSQVVVFGALIWSSATYAISVLQRIAA